MIGLLECLRKLMVCPFRKRIYNYLIIIIMGGAGSHRLSSLWWVMDFEFVFGLIFGVGN